jgi:hypothetical protein
VDAIDEHVGGDDEVAISPCGENGCIIADEVGRTEPLKMLEKLLFS